MQLLQQAAIFLLTAVVLVPIFQRLKLGAVLGYLIAGMLIGPWGLGVVSNVEQTLDFAELGIVLLLFLVGLELEPARLRALRRPIVVLGATQVGITALVIAAFAFAWGVDAKAAAVIGSGLAMSSTALVLATFAERGESGTRHAREAFAVLLFQDLAVIPLLALLPLLAGATAPSGVHPMAAAKGIAVIVIVIVAGRQVVRPALKFIAVHSSREVFTAAALLLVLGAALLMQKIGLSTSLGAFLAGVLLADSEFRHELEADIEPFKGLLMGLFFMAVGMSANLQLAWRAPHVLVGLALGFMIAKAIVMYAIARVAGRSQPAAEALAIALSQGGEFAFVLFAAASAIGVLDASTAQLLIMAVTTSMLLAPGVFALYQRWAQHRHERKATPEFDTITEPGNPVIIAGYGRFGQIVSRLLRMCGIPFTALEASYQQVDFVRRYGNRIYYGDATRLELLQAAKAHEAKLFVLAIDDVEASVKAAALVRRNFPRLRILARARNRVHYFRLRDIGVTAIYRETFCASLEVAQEALVALGLSAPSAQRAVALFRRHDEKQLDVQYAVHHDEAQLIQTTKQAAQQLQDLFESDTAGRLLDGARKYGTSE
ncbi:MAG TPA: monovalent cation:proton antiporter-2 (CPA2) family protein [Burkholderiales bacterium]|nr:monovalent cation:proton antiporter-2 (CPA2) family protein [Burkholderiales bacterium]